MLKHLFFSGTYFPFVILWIKELNVLRRVSEHAGCNLNFSNGTQALDSPYAIFLKEE